MSRLSLQILFAEDATAWLELPPNIAAWDQLYRDCPWRFPTLKADFYRLWLRHYGEDWRPLLVIGSDASGTLQALFPLAVRGTLVTGAGSHQAEYQGWLSNEDDADAFLREALRDIQTHFPSHRIRLRYLAPAIPSRAIAAACNDYRRAVLTQYPRPLLDLDRVSIEKSLRKKSTRSKLNRLRRKGEVDFRRLTDIAQIREHLNSIIAMYDLRQGAANNTCPFLEDPHKKAFMLDWAAQSADDELHISCMTLNGQAIAAHIGVNGDAETQLAILAYSPLYGACSPGKLQVYQTARMLLEEGRRCLDLTPGGDPWKERFANAHDQVSTLDVYPSNAQAMRIRLTERLHGYARAFLRGVGISPARLKALLRLSRRTTAGGFSGTFLPMRTEYVLYRVILGDQHAASPEGQVGINSLEHLTRCDPASPGAERQPFLAGALARLEAGDRVYTIADSDRLLCSAWLSGPHMKRFLAPVAQDIHFSTPSLLIDDLYFHPDTAKAADIKILLRRILSDLKEDGVQAAYLTVGKADMDNAWIKTLGFEPVGSAYLVRHLWRTRCWQDIHLEEDA